MFTSSTEIPSVHPSSFPPHPHFPPMHHPPPPAHGFPSHIFGNRFTPSNPSLHLGSLNAYLAELHPAGIDTAPAGLPYLYRCSS